MTRQRGTGPGRDDAHRRESQLEARLEQSRRYFEHHHAHLEPDCGFADRVALRAKHDPSANIAWAAMRLLPVSVLLALVLALVCLRPEPRLETASLENTDDDVLVWLLADKDVAP